MFAISETEWIEYGLFQTHRLHLELIKKEKKKKKIVSA